MMNNGGGKEEEGMSESMNEWIQCNVALNAVLFLSRSDVTIWGII